jgi:hypothetical protein
MATQITYDAERTIGRLRILEKANFNYAGGQAMKRLGYGLREHHGLQMAGRFADPVPFTLASPRYKADGLSVRFYLSTDGPKGNAPASYIYPTDAGDGGAKPAYLSRFARGLSKLNITNLFPIPNIGGTGVRKNIHGNMTPGQYQGVLKGLARQNPAYFSIPDNRRTSKRSTLLKPGIYQRAGTNSRGYNRLFGYIAEPPTVRTAYDFLGITTRYAGQQVPKLLREELAKVLRR